VSHNAKWDHRGPKILTRGRVRVKNLKEGVRKILSAKKLGEAKERFNI